MIDAGLAFEVDLLTARRFLGKAWKDSLDKSIQHCFRISKLFNLKQYFKCDQLIDIQDIYYGAQNYIRKKSITRILTRNIRVA